MKWLATLLAFNLLWSLCCAARPLLSESSKNMTSPAPNVGNTTRGSELSVNSTKRAVPPGADRKSVKVPKGRAVKDIPNLRMNGANDTNTTEPGGNTTYQGTALIQAITDPPAMYRANLDMHNTYRAKHADTPALAWDDTIADAAAAYASRCVWGHDPNNKQWGENLFAYSLDNNKAEFQMAGLKAWYDEIRLYDYNHHGFAEATGHFTQMIWKSSVRLGCAVASCPNGMANWSPGRVYLVCRYGPPGNYLGHFPQNVMPLATTAPVPLPATPPAPAPAPKPSPSPMPVVNPAPQPPVAVSQPPPSPSRSSTVLATPMEQGQRMPAGRCLVSPNQMHKLCLQTGGKLEIYRAGIPTLLWSNPFPFSIFSNPLALVLQPTGRLSVVSSSTFGFEMTQWSANMDNMGTAPYRLLVQDDGRAVLYDARGTSVWRTN